MFCRLHKACVLEEKSPWSGDDLYSDLGGCEHGWGRGRTHVQVAAGAGQGSGTVPNFHGIGLHEEVRAQNSVMSRRLIKLNLKLGKIVQSNDISRRKRHRARPTKAPPFSGPRTSVCSTNQPWRRSFRPEIVRGGKAA